VDGMLDINTSFNADPTFDLDPGGAYMGTLGDPHSNYYSGAIAHFASYNIALTANGVGSLVNGMPASHFVPLHYWPLWGDSPEADVGRGWTLLDGPIPGPRTPGILTGTTYTSSRRVGLGIVSLPARI